MANKYLRATGTSIDLSSTAFWSDTPNGATGGTVPATNDVVYLLEGGSDSLINAGHTALAAADLSGWFVAPQCGIRSTLPIQLNVSGTGTPILRHEGSGDMSYHAIGAAPIDVFVSSPTGGATVTITTGTSTNLPAVHALAGRTIIADAADPDLLIVSGVGTFCHMQASSAATPNIQVTGQAFLQLERDATTVKVYDKGSLLTRGNVDIGTLLDVGGGVVNIRSYGTIALGVIHSGIVTPEMAEGTTTFTNLTLNGSNNTTHFYSAVGGSAFVLTNAATGTANTQTSASFVLGGGGGIFSGGR